MEITLKFLNRVPIKRFPINYHYELASFVYKVLDIADPEYAKRLHQQGLVRTGNKIFKLYTFSKLHFEKFNSSTKKYHIDIQRGYIEWTFRTYENSLLNNVLKGLFMVNRLILHIKGETYNFIFVGLSNGYIPKFQDNKKYKFTCLSPIYVDTITDEHFNHVPDYFENPDIFSDIIKKNLINKYKAITGKDIQCPNFKFRFDEKYIKFRQNNITYVTYLNFKKGEPQKKIVYNSPFTIEGAPKELLKIGYYTGFGSKNSLGFGCAGYIGEEG